MSHPDASPEAGDLDPFLPGTWVHRIWSAMRGNYGAEFDRLWARPAHLEAAEHVESLPSLALASNGLSAHATILPVPVAVSLTSR